MKSITKKELLEKRFIKSSFSGENIEVLKESPYNDGLIIPTENSVFIREVGSKSYSFNRGCFIDYRKLLNGNFI